MKGFELGSIVPNGIGSSDAISMIYQFLLYCNGQNFNSVRINQIGEGTDPDEIVLRSSYNRNHVHVNIRYPARSDFDALPYDAQDRIRVDIAHEGLLRLAEFDRRYDVPTLVAIRDEILNNNFQFSFKIKRKPHPKHPELVAYLVVEPSSEQFLYYAVVERDGTEEKRVLFYRGQTGMLYFTWLFSKVTWKGSKLFLTGKMKVETIIDFESGEVQNFMPQPPHDTWFEIMLSEFPNEDLDQRFKAWRESLSPVTAVTFDIPKS